MDELAELRAEVRRLGDELRRVTDRAEIMELLNLRSAAVDSRDWATLRELFTPDVVLDHTQARDSRPGYHAEWKGRDEVMERVSKGVEQHLVSHHMGTNHRIDVRGDEATAVGVSFSVDVDPTPEGGQSVRFQQGWNVTKLTRTPEGWRVRWTRPSVWKSLVLPIAEPLSQDDLDARRRELRATYADSAVKPKASTAAD